MLGLVMFNNKMKSKTDEPEGLGKLEGGETKVVWTMIDHIIPDISHIIQFRQCLVYVATCGIGKDILFRLAGTLSKDGSCKKSWLCTCMILADPKAGKRSGRGRPLDEHMRISF